MYDVACTPVFELTRILCQVPRAQKASWKAAGLLTYRLGLLIVWTILALPGTVLNSPMFIIASIMSRKKAKGEYDDMYVRAI